MPVAGRKPKEGPKRNRMPAVHDWTEVEDVQFKGKPLVDLPATRTFVTKLGSPLELPLHAMTIEWWEVVRSMPHCRLWTKSDWLFAVATAFVADDAFRGTAGAMAELRQREKLLGTTLDSRRDLRIRYVAKGELSDSPPPPARGRAKTSNVTSIDSRRSRLTG